jgi:hypothetical protein
MTPQRTVFSEATNLAYIVAGITILLSAQPTGPIVGAAFILLGIGSWVYHHYYAEWANLMDERGMYVCFAAIVAAAPYQEIPEPWGGLLGAVILGVGVLMAIAAGDPRLATMRTMPAWALALVAAVWWTSNLATAGVLLVAFLLVAFLRELPESNFWTPKAWFRERYDGLHGLWHVGTCCLMLMAWMAIIGIWGVGR